jgi:hypothetical protein
MYVTTGKYIVTEERLPTGKVVELRFRNTLFELVHCNTLQIAKVCCLLIQQS